MRTLPLLALLFWLGAPFASATEFRDEVSVEEGGQLFVELTQGSIEIETHDEPVVQVEARAIGFGSESVTFSLTSEGRDAHLNATGGGAFPFFRFGPLRVRVRIAVPERYGATLHTHGGSVQVDGLRGPVHVETSGGSIDVNDVRGDLELWTSGGSIRVDDCKGSVRARTSGGSVRVYEVAGDVEAKTSGGSIHVHDIEGQVHARTSGGSITARFEEDPAGELETVGGSIQIEFDDDRGVEIDARSFGGRVSLEEGLAYTGRKENDLVKGEINGGGSLLRLRTTGGSIYLRGN